MKPVERLSTLAKHLKNATNSIQSRAMSDSATSVPRWQRVIEDALAEDPKANTFQLATVDTTGAPRVRSLIFRSFLSPRSVSHPLLLTTTDARTPKVAQFAGDDRVEIAWWLPKAQAQLRVRGRVHVLPAPDFRADGAGAGKEKEGIESAVKVLRERFLGAEIGGEGFDWEAERRARFDGVSGHMRASWARPVPGSVLPSSDSAKEWPETLPKLSESQNQNQTQNGETEAAFRNFALVLIDPAEVDYVELGVVPNRRTRFFKEESGEEAWKEEALVP